MEDDEVPAEAVAQIAAVIEPGAPVVRSWDITGGLSSAMTVIEVERPTGEVHRLVVRRAGRDPTGPPPA